MSFGIEILVAKICSVQSLSRVWLFATPWTAAHQASLSITNSRSLLKLHRVSPSSQCCHPTISSSVVPFSSCLQSFPASGSFPMSRFFASGGQGTGVSASASVLPLNIQDRFPLGLPGWISLQSKGLSRVFSNTTFQKRQFFGAVYQKSNKYWFRSVTSLLIHNFEAWGELSLLPIITYSLLNIGKVLLQAKVYTYFEIQCYKNADVSVLFSCQGNNVNWHSTLITSWSFRNTFIHETSVAKLASLKRFFCQCTIEKTFCSRMFPIISVNLATVWVWMSSSLGIFTFLPVYFSKVHFTHVTLFPVKSYRFMLPL